MGRIKLGVSAWTEPTLVKSGYLETRIDVDEFIKALRTALEQALADDERIEIR